MRLEVVFLMLVVCLLPSAAPAYEWVWISGTLHLTLYPSRPGGFQSPSLVRIFRFPSSSSRARDGRVEGRRG